MKSRKIRWEGHVAHVQNAHKMLVGKPEEKGPRGRHRRKWKDNIKMGVKEIA